MVNTKTKENKIRRLVRHTIRNIGILLLVSVFIWCGLYFWKLLNLEQTNNAHIEAYLSPVNVRVQGYIKSICFEENQRVNRGDTLLTIDSYEYEIKKREAVSNVVESKAKLDYLVANEETQQRNLEVIKTQIASSEVKKRYQQQEYDRYKNLLTLESTSQQQFDKIETDLAIASREYESTLLAYKVADAKVIEIQKEMGMVIAEIERKQALLEKQVLEIKYTVVTAPFNGRIGKKNIQKGQLVQPGQTLFFMVNDDEGKWVIANFKETQIGLLNIGQHVSITVDAFPSETFNGEIESVSPTTGSRYSLLPPDNATGNFVKIIQRIPVKIRLTDPKEKLEKLSPGMNANVSARNMKE